LENKVKLNLKHTRILENDLELGRKVFGKFKLVDGEFAWWDIT
jgi:hypothetical protein